ncbi:MAG: YbjN domain-containing protein [Propionibacteriaceae bacterium]|nr:YbjN domain-containing protein [Propionibacteriaceae bacterium]
MARSLIEANAAIGRVRAMPYGQARSEAAEREVRLIEREGPPEAKAYALTSLVEALTWANEPDRATLHFTRLLRWWDERPELFDHYDQSVLFWEFGWVMSDLPRNPAVAKQRIDDTLDDMERRFAVANRGMERVWSARLDWAMMRGGDDAEAVFTRWLTQPLDPEDSCPACHEDARAGYLMWRGQRQEAIAVLRAAIDSELTCSREPAAMLTHLAAALLDEGDYDQVEAVLPQALAELGKAAITNLGLDRALVFEIFGRSGRPDLAGELLAERGREWASGTPYGRLEAWRHLAAGTGGLVATSHGQAPLTLPGSPAQTAAELHQWALEQAWPLARQFDRRNGTAEQTRRLRAALEKPAADRRLEFALPSAEPAANRSPVPDSAVALSRPPADGPTAAPTAARRLAETELAADGRPAAAARAFAQAARQAQEQGLLRESGWCWAEAAHCWQTVELSTRADALVAGRQAGRSADDGGSAVGAEERPRRRWGRHGDGPKTRRLGRADGSSHDASHDDEAEAGRLGRVDWSPGDVASDDRAATGGRPGTASRAYAEALSRLVAADVPGEELARVLVAWAPVVAPGDEAAFTAAAGRALDGLPEPPEDQSRPVTVIPFDVFPLLRRQLKARADIEDAWARVLSRRAKRLAATAGAAQAGDPDSARRDALARVQAASKLYKGLGLSLDQAHADWLVARLEVAAGDTAEAADRLRTAAELFQRAGRRAARHHQDILSELALVEGAGATRPLALSRCLLDYDKDRPRAAMPAAAPAATSGAAEASRATTDPGGEAAPTDRAAVGGRRRLGDMGYFTRPDGSPLSVEVAPLSNERVQVCLDSHDWHYRVDSDGDIGGWWDGHWFYFFVRGYDHEILFVQGRWDRGLKGDQLEALIRWANDWNRDHLWPKLAAVEREDSVIMLASLGASYAQGLTDAQLDEHVRGAIATSIDAFNWLDEQYPVEAAAASANE